VAGIKHRVEPSASALAALQSGAGTTWYLNGEDSQGLTYEREEKTNGITEHKHYLSAGGMVFAMQVTRSGTLAAGNAAIGGNLAASLRYFHHDQLGSVAAVSDGITGAVIERLAYDPWGKRRSVNGLSDITDSLTGLTTDRGFTMHEHLDEMGLVHMNGRIYDPLIGRFMSADPILQAPSNLQSHNRYAYVMNNPLNLTDPSGFISFRKLLGYATFGILGNSRIGRTVLTMAACLFGGPAGCAAATTLNAYVSGATPSQALRSGGIAFLSAYAFQLAGGAGSGGGVSKEIASRSVERYLAHAAAGCVSAAIGGGQCGTGAVSAVFGKFATNAIGGTPGQFDAFQAAATVVAGGVGSVIAGEKFENGAKTAAYGYLFNQLSEKYTIYERTGPNGECYVGHCKTDRFVDRQAEHDRATGRTNSYKETDRLVGSRLDARIVEETRIRNGGGLDVLENKRYEVSERNYRAAGGSAPMPIAPRIPSGGGAGRQLNFMRLHE
jgi:RHS repeat-associated protein